MLVRMDKEFSDITYIPTQSLGHQIDDICKRNVVTRDPLEKLHGRPYYDHEETKRDFDKSSAGQSHHIEAHPELAAKLQAEMKQRKQKEQRDLEERRRIERQVELQWKEEQRRSV